MDAVCWNTGVCRVDLGRLQSGNQCRTQEEVNLNGYADLCWLMDESEDRMRRDGITGGGAPVFCCAGGDTSSDSPALKALAVWGLRACLDEGGPWANLVGV